jgi:exopolysaccharide biosynthesis polyprenyl glycosylphosphotransferase
MKSEMRAGVALTSSESTATAASSSQQMHTADNGGARHDTLGVAQRRKRVLIIGAGKTGHMIALSLMERFPHLYDVIGFLDDESDRGMLPNAPILGTTNDIAQVLEEHRVDEVIVAYVPSWYQTLLENVFEHNGGRHLEVKVVPRLYETMIGKMRFTQVNEIPLLSLNGSRVSPFMENVHRLNDVVIAAAMLVLLSPLLLLTAILVRLTSRGPVIYKQERVGKDGKPFFIYKFRTMVQDAERHTGPVLSSPDDDRATLIGRILRSTKIDECPQFANVLRGEMSIVGPRPERPVFVEQYEREVPAYALRHTVKPGITGLAQINAGYLVNVHDKIKYDLMYVFNRSILLDWKIFFATPFKMLFSGRK